MVCGMSVHVVWYTNCELQNMTVAYLICRTNLKGFVPVYFAGYLNSLAINVLITYDGKNTGFANACRIRC